MAGRQTGGRLRAFLFLTVSLAAAAVAAAVIWSVITSYQQELAEANKAEETVQVIVAAHDLAQGRTIATEDLKPKDLPPDYVPNAVLREAAQAIGRVPRERILVDEFIREERLADPEAGVGLNAIIPRGMRAVSVNISGGAAVSGFLNPGNYVDVLVTVTGGTGGPKTETNTLLQAITVLAVNARMGVGGGAGNPNAQGGGSPSVTLAVTPEQAEILTHAVAESRVTLTLRNDIDVTHVETNGAFSTELLGGNEEEQKRIPITEWKSRATQRSDGSLLIIRGTAEAKEKVK